MKKELEDNASKIERHIAALPSPQREKMEEMRSIICSAAKGAVEVISYGMPAIREGGILVYYDAHETHIGFYPTPSPILVFGEEIKIYQVSKGAIRFPMNQDLPADLITRIVQFRLNEERQKRIKKAEEKRSGKKD